MECQAAQRRPHGCTLAVNYDDVQHLSVGLVEALHVDALADFGGGDDGLRDRAQLESAVRNPRQTCAFEPLYPTIATMAAAYLELIALGHPFVDGNKRTAVYAAGTFLEMNGYQVTLGEGWEQRILDVVTHKATREDLVGWLVEEMGGTDEPVE